MPRMAVRSFIFLVTLAVVGAGLGPQAARAAGLDSRIADLLTDPQLKNASVSISVVEITAAGPRAVYGHNAQMPLAPASCTKLLTTAAAFEKYGPNATFKTQLYQMGDDLLLVGSGDPGLGDSALCAQAGWPVTHTFDTWAQHLKAAGVTHYRDLIIDDHVFDDQFVHPDWPKDQLLAWYEAGVGGLNFNDNCLDWRPVVTGGQISVELIPPNSYATVTNKATRGAKNQVWMWRPAGSAQFELRGTVAATAVSPASVSVDDPGLWTGTVLHDALSRAGVTGSGTVRRADKPAGPAVLLATNETKLMAIIGRANTDSINMMAEALCKRLGYDQTGRPGTWQAGTAAVEAYARSIGVPAGLVDLQDGSGMSARDRAAAQAFTTVLAHIAQRADGQVFLDTLAVPGEGTLRRRFVGSPLAKRVRAKTGHISEVSCLAGILTVPQTGGASRRFAFAILCNGYKGNVNGWQEKVVAAVDAWGRG